MTIGIVTRWVTRLIPARHKRAASQAENEAVRSRTVMRDVAKRSHKVDQLMQNMAADLIENHYADRVAEAMGRMNP